MDWFTSDTHAYHSNIIKYCKRPWPDAESMTVELARNINHCVKSVDTLYHLGDWAFGNIEKAEKFRSMINCQNIVLIRGNHDKDNFYDAKRKDKFKNLFTSIHEVYEKKINGQYIVMCHYPMLSWNHHTHGSWMLHGHCHFTLPIDLDSKRIDVGVDSWYPELSEYQPTYQPYCMDNLTDIMKTRNICKVDHH